ncbi:chromosomal replication initiator protein DnaA [Streptomyces scabiei]|uniref:hypothetical protein n=1 Tax=Streptomyces scabiei TaxID=1930 RepID=UPI000765C72D|nr:hypothetical protein [Streptomyces scabiei]
MSTTPSTRGRRSRAHADATQGEPHATPETEDTMGADETQLRRVLSRIGVRPLGHAEQPVDEEPEPAAHPAPHLPSVTATRRNPTEPGGGRLPAPGQTIDLTEPPEQQVRADEPTLPEEQDDMADPAQPPETRRAGEAAKRVWPPRVPWRRQEDNDQAEGPATAVGDDDLPQPEGDQPDWYRVQKTDDPQAPDPGTYEVHNHYYGTAQGSSAPAGEGAGWSRNRGSLTAWWASLTPLQRFILHNGSAATAGAWGWGMFTAQWNTGLPQWTLAVMHDAAAGSAEPSTPFIVGGGVVLLAAVVGGGITAFTEKWLYRLPSFCAAIRFLTHIPVASAGIALLLFSAPSL